MRIFWVFGESKQAALKIPLGLGEYEGGCILWVSSVLLFINCAYCPSLSAIYQ